MVSSRDLTFSVLQSRLLEEIRVRIRNGEFTERGLARLAGLSQPHLHNLLKGARDLTAHSADSLLVALDIGTLHLARPEELGEALELKTEPCPQTRVIAVLGGKVGPGWPLPDTRQPASWQPLPAGLTHCGRRPVLATLAYDPRLGTALSSAKEAIFDLDETARTDPLEGQWYLVRHHGGALVRQVRVSSDRIEILGQLGLGETDAVSVIPLAGTSVLHVVRGRLVWAGDSRAGQTPGCSKR